MNRTIIVVEHEGECPAFNFEGDAIYASARLRAEDMANIKERITDPLLRALDSLRKNPDGTPESPLDAIKRQLAEKGIPWPA